MKNVLLIIPAYNEEKNIKTTVDHVLSHSPGAAYQLDYIVVNDGSRDGTGAVCRREGIRCLPLVQNLGIGGAVQTGYLYALQNGYDIAVQFDGDGQHDIASLDALIEPILQGEVDFTVGSRFVDGTSDFRSTFMRRLGIRYLSLLIRIVSGGRIKDPTSGYRAANRKAIAYLASNYPADYPEPESIVALLKKGFRLREVQVNMFERAAGKSSISFWKSIYYMFKVSLAILCTSMQRKEKS